MYDSEFIVLAERMLETIERRLDTSAADLDCSRTSDGVLEIEFDDGSKVIVNRHAAAQEIWVAARAGGFHFRWDGSAWKDTRDGRELTVVLSAVVSAQAGGDVDLRDGS